ncbi:MAG: beta-propeller fold lactonase family protein, partial [Planctomycetota bacterium]
TGRLTFVGIDPVSAAAGVTVSPDGSRLYVARPGDNAVNVYARDTVTGALALAQSFRDGQEGVDGLQSVGRATVTPDGRFVFTSSWAEDAISTFEFDDASGELQYLRSLWNGDGGINGLWSAQATATSPDGRHVYVVASADDSVTVFSRDPGTGDLSMVQILRDGRNGANGLAYARVVAVSPDGRHVYVSGLGNELGVFARDGDTGELTFVERIGVIAGGANNMPDIFSLHVSSDGNHCYALNGWGSILIFDRDLTTGRLTYSTACRAAPQEEADSLTFSPDGKDVYAGIEWRSSIARLTRDPGTGLLTFVELVSGGDEAPVSGLEVAVSPDGRHVYAAGADGNLLTIFDRDSVTGELTVLGPVAADTGPVEEVSRITVSPDGKNVYVIDERNGALAVFGRDPQTGLLWPAQSIRNNRAGVTGLGGLSSVNVSPDGEFVYTTAWASNALAVFRRGAATPAAQVSLETRAEGVLREGIASLAVSFTQPVGALTPADVLLTERTLGEIACDGVRIAPDGLTATLSLARLLAGATDWDTYTLTVLDGATDLAGAPLDGDGDGTPGGDHVVSFSVAMLGDANLDGAVRIADLVTVADNYGRSGVPWRLGDFTDDGTVGIADLSVLADNYGRNADGAQPATGGSAPATPLGSPAIAASANSTASEPAAADTPAHSVDIGVGPVAATGDGDVQAGLEGGSVSSNVVSADAAPTFASPELDDIVDMLAGPDLAALAIPGM